MVIKIIGHYYSRYTDLFVEVGEENGIDLQHKVMNTEMDTSIFYEANIGMGYRRFVNRYLT